MAAYEVLLLNTAVPQIQAAQAGDTYVVPRDIAFSAALTLSAGTANGVPYLNASKVLTTGSALTFDGTRLGIGSTANTEGMLTVGTGTVTDKNGIVLYRGAASSVSTTQVAIFNELNGIGSGESLTLRSPAGFKFQNNDGSSEWMRLTSTGLGIGTSSPAAKLHVAWSSDQLKFTNPSAGFKQIGASYTGYVSGNDYAAIILGTDGSSGGKIEFGVTPNAGSLTTAATLDRNGNLGLGVTPSAWGSVFRAIDIGDAGISAAGIQIQTVSNAFWDGTNYRYKVNGLAARAIVNNGGHAFEIAPSGTAGNAISFTQAMTLDASGNLTLGQTSSALQSGGTGITLYGSSFSELKFLNSTTGQSATDGTALLTSSSDFLINNREAGAITFGTSNTERARITSGGDFQTSSGNSVMVGGTAARATTAGTNRVDIFDGTAPVGTLANGVSFYSASGEANVMDAAGNATLLSPHDAETNEWIFRSKHTPTGKVLKIDVERLLKFVNDHFGLDAVHEFIED